MDQLYKKGSCMSRRKNRKKIARYGVLSQDILGRPGQSDFEVGLYQNVDTYHLFY